MIKITKKSSQKAGLPPGSLVHVGDYLPMQVTISTVDFSKESIIVEPTASLENCLTDIKLSVTRWIQVRGLSDLSLIQKIGEKFKIHSLVLEDILNTNQRAKIDVLDSGIFLVMRLLKISEVTKRVTDEQVSLFIGENFLISFLENDNPIFEPIIQRMQQNSGRLRSGGVDYLAYTLLDLVVDNYFFVLEKVDEEIDRLEVELLHSPGSGLMLKIQTIKRDIINLRRSIWPMRELVNKLLHLEHSFISTETQIYIKDVYDHLIQTNDLVESFRDVSSGLMDVYLSNINIRMNEIMKVLTIVSTIFVPLTFITGLYGMNFKYIPELEYPWAYPIVLFGMFSLAIFMLIYFRFKRWY